ncbi:NAD(P)/FAD-dependent oxidoreductase [Halalkalicoccus salilacus]|uniref:NAD(P)/FAD-dependent oxidoreductase n=1 Tax=Halalkalicoccus sp. GCM10025704 TaxID=3252662 RepID=UPI00361EDA9D
MGRTCTPSSSGGIVGLASAHALAERDVRVTVCEKGSLGGGSTGRSAGGIRAQFSTPVNVELSLVSFETWDAFEERFGVDIAHRRVGYLFLAREEATAERLRENVAMQNERGVPSAFLTPEEAVERCGGLRLERFVGASYSPKDGFADPNLALQGYARAAREAGVEIRTNAGVTGIRRDAERVVGVECDGERFDADRVVNAAGPWARRVARMAGVELPVAPRRRQMAVVDPERPVPESDPFTIDLDTASYFRPEREGIALVGGQWGEDPDTDPDRYREGMELEWAADAVERAGESTTYFGPETRIRRGWAGLYAVTPDNHPIVEETVPGLVNAVGFSGHGFMHAPATGKLVAELVCDGEASLVDAEPLRSDRFGSEVTTERNVV